MPYLLPNIINSVEARPFPMHIKPNTTSTTSPTNCNKPATGKNRVAGQFDDADAYYVVAHKSLSNTDISPIENNMNTGPVISTPNDMSSCGYNTKDLLLGIGGGMNMNTDPVISTPNDMSSCGYNNKDVLLGRGGGTNRHEGNRYFRNVVAMIQPNYVTAPRLKKKLIAGVIVKHIKDRGGRFLRCDDATGLWVDAGDKKATLKASQALREGAAKEMRQFLMLSGTKLHAKDRVPATVYPPPIMYPPPIHMPPTNVRQIPPMSMPHPVYSGGP